MVFKVPSQFCLCGVSVHSAVQVLSWVAIICNVLSIISILGSFVLFAALGFIPVFIAVGLLIGYNVIRIIFLHWVLVGLREKRPEKYLPFLILSVIEQMLSAFCLAMFLLFGKSAILQLFQANAAYSLIFVLCLFGFAAVGISYYLFFHLPNNSRKLLIYELENTQVPVISSIKV
ncbi:hypothetical protein M3Y97_01089700 [Aphelenchoides bicaudatus]|nr:hypothetical protein M3Y97_01089700 [Aphelenchoides bicaudatus]